MPKGNISYTIEELLQACDAVSKGMSLRKASDKFKVPKTTIHNRLHSRYPGLPKYDQVSLKERYDEAYRQGRYDQVCRKEQRLVHWYVFCKQAGFINLTNRRLIMEAKYLLKEYVAEVPNIDTEWCEQFQARYKRIQLVNKLCSKHSTTLQTWFKGIGAFCRERKMLECLKQPLQLLYCCQLHLTDSVKVMLTYSSHGLAAPPVLVHATLKQSELDCHIPKGWLFLKDTDDILRLYLPFVLDKSLKEENTSYPLLLFMDYQDRPLSLKLYELCCKLNIFVINSYCTAFKYTRDIQQQLTNEIQNSANRNLNSYLKICKRVLRTELTQQNMYLNFLESGIYPFDIGNIRLAPQLRFDVKYGQTIPPAVQEILQPTTIKLEHFQPVSTNVVPMGSQTKSQTEIVLNFNEFASIVGPDILYKLQMSLHSLQDSKASLEFRALLTIYRKFYAPICDNDVEVQNEPLIEDSIDFEYLVPEIDIDEI